MIKFFRHIRQSLINQNRIGKYFKYAIGEIVLVMIGILLALQVSNWNENRKTRNQELALLKNLKLEMVENSKLLDTYIEYKETSIADITKLLSYTSPNYRENKTDSLAFKLSQIFSIDNFKPEIMVLKAAQNSNSIKLIRNDRVKTCLSKWEQSLDALMEFDTFGTNQFNNSVVPIISDHFPFLNVRYNRSNSKNEVLSEHKSDLETLFRSRDFENRIFRLRNFYMIRTSKAEELKKLTLDMITFIEEEFKN